MELAIYNPHGKPVQELPVIYGFNAGEGFGGVIGQLVSSDGWGMGSHACTVEAYIPYDLGCYEGRRPDRHEGFKLHFPDGYRMEFVPTSQQETNEGFLAALAAAKERVAAAKGEG